MALRTWLTVQPQDVEAILPAESLQARVHLCPICGYIELQYDGIASEFVKRRKEMAKGLSKWKKRRI